MVVQKSVETIVAGIFTDKVHPMQYFQVTLHLVLFLFVVVLIVTVFVYSLWFDRYM